MIIYTIYKITNLVNNKIYIGYTSKSSNERFKRHVAAHTNDRWGHIKLYRAFKKYGINNFIVSDIYQSKDKSHIQKEMENYFISLYDSMNDSVGYNMCIGGQGGNIKSKEALIRDSLRYQGENNPMLIIKRTDPERYKELCDKRDFQRDERFKTGDNIVWVKVYIIKYLGVNFYIKEARKLDKFCNIHRIKNPTKIYQPDDIKKTYIGFLKYKCKQKEKSSITYKKFIEDFNNITYVN